MLLWDWVKEIREGLQNASWEWNPFHKMPKDHILNSDLTSRFLDTFSIFWGAWESRTNGKSDLKIVGLVDYLLFPLEIIEALLLITIIGIPLAILLAGLQVFILEPAIALILTLVCTPFILATHGICQIINYFNPPVRQNKNSKNRTEVPTSELSVQNEDVPRFDQNLRVVKTHLEEENIPKNESSPVSQPKIPAQAKSVFSSAHQVRNNLS